MSDVIAALSLEQVHRLTGVSLDQLREWDNTGFFQPSLAYENRRSPYSRIYTFEDVVALRTLSILRNQVSMQHLRKAADKLKCHSGKPWSELTLYVLNDEVNFLHPLDGTVEGAITGQYGATIPLASVAEEMREKATALKERRPETVGHIAKHRNIMGGRPVIAGTRIPVDSVRAFADAGFTPGQILGEYPILKLADIDAALAFGTISPQAA